MLCIKLISKSRTNLKTNNHCQKISDDSLIFFLITFDKEGQRFFIFSEYYSLWKYIPFISTEIM